MWKRFKIYQGIIVINLLLSLLFYIVNEDYLNYYVPKDISALLFWLSLGIYIGFQLCKYEIKRIMK